MIKVLDLFTSQDFYYSKMLFQRSLAFIYLMGFLIMFNQGKALLGKNGILPARIFISKVKFSQSPSIFYFFESDQFMTMISVLGAIISVLAIFGITEKYGHAVSMISWFILWITYLSFVNIGQVWFGYGWESMLLEAGFLAIFLGPANVAAPVIVIWLIRWVCFRNMLGAGLIKLRGDEGWRNLTCMTYYYETQPVPNQLSILFHRLPVFLHKGSVLFTFFVEIVAAIGLMLPWWFVGALAGGITILFHIIIILSGNLSWLNYISIVLCIPCFSDVFFIRFFNLPAIATAPLAIGHQWLVYVLGIFVSFKSWGPIQNLFSSRQSMNRSFDRLHLVNTYGAFGSITKVRNELVVLGTMDENPENAKWEVYEFKGKPTDVNRMPSLMSPYHWKIDWQMWFAAFGDYQQSPWVLNLVAKLLYADPDALSLLASEPFNRKKPKWVKIDYYKYNFQDPGKSGYWKRKYLGEWLPPLNLEHESFRNIIKSNDWDPR
ncbi:MAG: lipase maturation factor family protein [Bacteriovoracaceae bacterium]|nr:lipase maturation factor family protein [Bacteriovoracaceae bacterium]